VVGGWGAKAFVQTGDCGADRNGGVLDSKKDMDFDDAGAREYTCEWRLGVGATES
jgi:hypothetical protein